MAFRSLLGHNISWGRHPSADCTAPHSRSHNISWGRHPSTCTAPHSLHGHNISWGRHPRVVQGTILPARSAKSSLFLSRFPTTSPSPCRRLAPAHHHRRRNTNRIVVRRNIGSSPCPVTESAGGTMLAQRRLKLSVSLSRSLQVLSPHMALMLAAVRAADKPKAYSNLVLQIRVAPISAPVPGGTVSSRSATIFDVLIVSAAILLLAFSVS